MPERDLFYLHRGSNVKSQTNYFLINWQQICQKQLKHPSRWLAGLFISITDSATVFTLGFRRRKVILNLASVDAISYYIHSISYSRVLKML